MPRIPDLVVGTAARHGAVTVLPLFPTVAQPGVTYRLGAHALASGALEIGELPGGAVVDRLEARNGGADRVLFIEGDHLIGSKQNRVVTSSAMLRGRRTATLAVSCVERGRWTDGAARFRSTGGVAPASLRSVVKHSVTSALLQRRERSADQSAIWSRIAEQQRRLRVTSATSALEHSYLERAGDLGAAATRLPYAAQAIGLAIGIDGQLVSIDVFDQPATCSFYWRPLIEGAALEALDRRVEIGGGGGAGAGGIGTQAVEALLDELRRAAWAPVPPVGEGEERRARMAESVASALWVDGQVVHLGVAAGRPPEAVCSPGRPMRRELPPELAGRYRVVARLGAGGAKEVFRAADAQGGPDVAIARVPYVHPEEFTREVELLRRVASEYVPVIHAAFVDAHDDGYLVMELCDGPNLAQLAERPLRPVEAGPILLALARGVRAIHAAHVLHRDIKPENVVLCRKDGQVQLKILDFGLSGRARDETSALIDLRGFSGTLPYMAREAIRGMPVDARADAFAFGVCCYRLLTGQVPHPPRASETDFDYIHRLANVELGDLSLLPVLLPEVAELVRRLLSPDAEQRPYLPEVVAVLERVYGDAPLEIPAHDASGVDAEVGVNLSADFDLTELRRRAALEDSSVVRPASATVPPRRPTPVWVRQIAVPTAGPEGVLVAACSRAPLVVLDPGVDATVIRGISETGRVRWSRRVEGRLVTGLRADLDGDGEREIYLAGSDRVIALDRRGKVRYVRPVAERAGAAGAAGVPTLAAVMDPAARRLLVDGLALEPRTGLPLGVRMSTYEGDGTQLARAADLRGASYHVGALQAFRGAHGTGAAIIARPGAERFFVAQLEEDRAGRSVQLGIYGPGGARVRGLRAAECEVITGDAATIAQLAAGQRRLVGPEHAPLAALGPDGSAVVIAPLVGADPAVPSGIVAFALADGRELWRRRLPARRGRAVLGDLDGDGRPELFVGTGDRIFAFDPWTGEPLAELGSAGLPVAVGDPFGSGASHLIAASEDGIEIWRGQPCPKGAMQWSGLRGDLWRTGTARADGGMIGPI